MAGRLPVVGETRLRGRRYTIRALCCDGALEILAAGAEPDRERRAIAHNACLVAHCLYRGGRRAFRDAQDALASLTLDELATLAQDCRYALMGERDYANAAFDRAQYHIMAGKCR